MRAALNGCTMSIDKVFLLLFLNFSCVPALFASFALDDLGCLQLVRTAPGQYLVMRESKAGWEVIEQVGLEGLWQLAPLIRGQNVVAPTHKAITETGKVHVQSTCVQPKRSASSDTESVGSEEVLWDLESSSSVTSEDFVDDLEEHEFEDTPSVDDSGLSSDLNNEDKANF